ncbi:MAG: hypothetical protein ABWY63_10105 [Hyphomicrobiaceae bacterium]
MTTGDIDAFCRPGAIQFAVATLESWESLRAVLDDLKTEGIEVEVAVMLAVEARARIEAGDAAAGAVPALLGQGVELQFPGSQLRTYCTAGKIADALGRRRAEGARSLADAFTGWLIHAQAVEMQRQISRGRLVAWLELSEPEQRAIVCGRVVAASIDMVGLCSIDMPQAQATETI